MTTVTAIPLARSAMARRAGVLYLTYIVLNIVASLVGRIGLSDAATLEATIADDEAMFRLGLVAALGSGLLFVLTAWALYALLRPVDGTVALLFLVLNAVGVAVQCASYLPLLTALSLRDSSTGTAGLDGLAALSVTTYQPAFVMAQLFFSAWLFPLGWLVLRSGFLPRFLGWLLILDGVGVLVWFLQVFLAPDYPAISYPAWAIGLVAELGLALWLVIKGAGPYETPTAPSPDAAV
ncbi:DUF4386 domain-containing protein [Cellulomonas sp. WB94]|uniref:DUF4386 domain-containing protein n=1 Tax=Cellulomonas sp. WB94 TaxID=2173174 RepID=UPI000D576A1F|nr:DUF4386 domain-containing protein [Cellulomonas sp. WB94]PVU82752.1 DUF4386 domain-containing protein [Cellulomonas sp. WB94]